MTTTTAEPAVATAPPAPTSPNQRLVRARMAHGVLAVLLGLSCVASLAIGASDTSLWSAIVRFVTGQPLTITEQIVLWDIRAPRTLTGVLVGAALGVSGTVLQGLFRNPLADPGIVGVSAGASLGAITMIVLGGLLPVAVQQLAGPLLVPLAAGLGGWAVVMGLYAVATRDGQTSVVTMLLAGIAVAALVGAATGVLIFLADDQQLRDLTFWGLGSLAGATWPKLLVSGAAIALALGAALGLGPSLNALALGEATAQHMGIATQAVKRRAILVTALATGAAVAVAGVIGFIGIVVPHLLRLSTGPDHGPLILNAALLGGALMLWADVVARVMVAPAELPIGIITALIGAPVFLWVLLRQSGGGWG